MAIYRGIEFSTTIPQAKARLAAALKEFAAKPDFYLKIDSGPFTRVRVKIAPGKILLSRPSPEAPPITISMSAPDFVLEWNEIKIPISVSIGRKRIMSRGRGWDEIPLQTEDPKEHPSKVAQEDARIIGHTLSERLEQVREIEDAEYTRQKEVLFKEEQEAARKDALKREEEARKDALKREEEAIREQEKKQAEALRARSEAERVKRENEAANPALDLEDVTNFLRNMTTKMGGRMRRVEYQPPPYPMWIAEPTNRQRLDTFGNDGQGWDSAGYLRQYEKPLSDQVQDKLADRFAPGLFNVDVGDKGHVEVRLTTKGNKALETLRKASRRVAMCWWRG